MQIDIAQINAAYDRIHAEIHRTPILTSSAIDAIAGCRISFKCESFQKTGSFKARGALNAVLALPESVTDVATHSSGNHAAAVAYAASLQGLKAHIVMPENSVTPKIRAVESYGGQITFCGPSTDDRLTALSAVVSQTGAEIIPPYADERIIAGQGTIAKEILEEIQDADVVMTPIGGGGLLAGVASWIKQQHPEVQVIGAEPTLADDAAVSLRTGIRQTQRPPRTIADGLRTVIGEINFEIIKDTVDDILTCSEIEIIEAMQLIWNRMNIVIETSCAVPLASLLSQKEQFSGKHVVIVLTGGNVDTSVIFDRLRKLTH